MNARVFDHLIERLRCVAAGLPDRRTGDNTRFSMADIALSAFVVFSTENLDSIGGLVDPLPLKRGTDWG